MVTHDARATDNRVLPWPGLSQGGGHPCHCARKRDHGVAVRVSYSSHSLTQIGKCSPLRRVRCTDSRLTYLTNRLLIPRLRTAERGADVALSRSGPGLRVGKAGLHRAKTCATRCGMVLTALRANAACVDLASQAPRPRVRQVLVVPSGITVCCRPPLRHTSRTRSAFGWSSDTMRVRTRLQTLGPATRTLMVNTVARPRRFPSAGEVGRLLASGSAPGSTATPDRARPSARRPPERAA